MEQGQKGNSLQKKTILKHFRQLCTYSCIGVMQHNEQINNLATHNNVSIIIIAILVSIPVCGNHTINF